MQSTDTSPMTASDTTPIAVSDAPQEQAYEASPGPGTSNRDVDGKNSDLNLSLAELTAEFSLLRASSQAEIEKLQGEVKELKQPSWSGVLATIKTWIEAV